MTGAEKNYPTAKATSRVMTTSKYLVGIFSDLVSKDHGYVMRYLTQISPFIFRFPGLTSYFHRICYLRSSPAEFR